jgi:hypothetical protein
MKAAFTLWLLVPAGAVALICLFWPSPDLGNLDILLLGALTCLIGVAVLSKQRKAIQIGVALILLFTAGFSVLTLDAFAPRLAVSQHERTGGKWSEDFRDGVVAVTRVSRPYHPYIVISSIGLAVIAILGQKRKRDHD